MRKITDMLVLYVLCAVLESACGITNHVVVSLLLLFIEVCAVISAKHGGKDICGDGLSVIVFSDKRDIIWLSGCTVCRLGTGAGGMGEKRDKKDGSSRHYSFFVGVFWRCGIALYPVGYRQDTLADTMDCF